MAKKEPLYPHMPSSRIPSSKKEWHAEIEVWVKAETREQAWKVAQGLADKINGTVRAVAMKPE